MSRSQPWMEVAASVELRLSEPPFAKRFVGDVSAGRRKSMSVWTAESRAFLFWFQWVFSLDPAGNSGHVIQRHFAQSWGFLISLGSCSRTTALKDSKASTPNNRTISANNDHSLLHMRNSHYALSETRECNQPDIAAPVSCEFTHTHTKPNHCWQEKHGVLLTAPVVIPGSGWNLCWEHSGVNAPPRLSA